MAAEYYKLDKLAEMTKQLPQTGHWSQVVTDTKYEKGLSINFGISREVVGSKRIAMGRTIIPPHTCNERHVHLYAEASMYIIRGTMVLLIGPEAKKILCPPGTFVFAPEGVIHGVANASRTEAASRRKKLRALCSWTIRRMSTRPRAGMSSTE